ncbi:MAG: ribosome maturation factor RimP [Tissierellaceae bacterium]|nr:ribosome maturation factor RimP [Tissierellaceae bacterium]
MNNNSRMNIKSNKREILKSVRHMSQNIAEELNFELVDLEYIKEFGSYFLRIYIDKLGGISTDDCEKMSARLSEALDEEDPIKEAYFLEVSSPGLDRPLKTDKDLKRNLDKDVEIKLYKPLNNKKNYEGSLKDFNDEEIIIEDNQGNIISLPREVVSIIRLAIKF